VFLKHSTTLLILAEHGSGMPIDCTSLLQGTNFSTWNAATSAAITTYQAKTTTTQAEDDTMLVLEKDMLDASMCVSNAINNISSTSSDIADMNEQIINKSLELASAQEDINVAKDRVGYIRHPERNTSPYESWFPIDRPISVFSLILIMCISIFMGVFLILLVLSYIGIDLTIYMAESSGPPNPMVEAILSQFTVSFWILLIAFISVVIYFVKRN